MTAQVRRPIVVSNTEAARARLAKAVAEHEEALAKARAEIIFHERAIVALKRAADRLVAEGAER
jgi:DNA-binding MarR family transcriptional regulator